MSNIDIALTLNTDNVYDISIDSNGDLLGTTGLDSAILMSALCEKRAVASELIKPEFRRGDWSNELNDIDGYEVGSKLWLLDTARTVQESLDFGIDYINDGFKWMIDDNIIKSVETTGEFIVRGMRFTVEMTKQDDSINTEIFDVYDTTRQV